MPRILSQYVTFVEAVNYRLGRIAMYGIFFMVGLLLWSSISKTFFLPSLWTLESAQFAMVAYYILGGPYSIQLGSNVRMDLFYAPWSNRKKAWVDSVTAYAVGCRAAAQGLQAGKGVVRRRVRRPFRCLPGMGGSGISPPHFRLGDGAVFRDNLAGPLVSRRAD